MLLSPEQIATFMERALHLAGLAAEKDEVPVGALLVRDHQVIGEGFNLRESSQRTLSHAELMALESYNRKHSQWRVPPETSLFVTAEPCLMCTGALLWARVDRIYYGCRDTKNAGISRIWDLIQTGVYDHRFAEVRGGILADRCASLLSGYFRGKRSHPSPIAEPRSPVA